MKRTMSKALCVVMIMAMVFLYGCSSYPSKNDANGDDTIVSQIGRGTIADDSSVDQTGDSTIEDVYQGTVVLSPYFISDNYEDYIGDIETFVYGLIINQLEYFYDVFPACVELSDTQCVYGLGYTDYAECYTDEDETQAYFMAGFMPFVGELEVPEDEFDTGLLLYNLDYQDEETTFVWYYQSDPFSEHCVVFGKYLIYGVDETGGVFFRTEEYARGYCDESLGSLYSYDDSRYVFDVDFGEYVPITGVSLSTAIDFTAIQEEIEEYIKRQDLNAVSIDVQSVAYGSQSAIESYLLSLQQETFLGYDLNVLIEAAQELDPLECFRITPEGLTVIDIEPIPPAQPTLLAKWLVGTGCVILAAVGIVGSIIFIECPPLSALAGAMTGAAIEIFMGVVVENQTLSDLDWRKVAVAAAAGAVCGFIGPYIQTLGGAAYYITDTLADGIIGGVTNAVFELMDGHSWQDAAQAFGWGVVMGVAISGGLKIVGAAVSRASKGIAKGIGKLSQKIPKTVVNKASKMVDPGKKMGQAIGKALGNLKKKADSSIFHSKYIGRALFVKQAMRLSQNGSHKLANKSFDKLAPDGLLNDSGKSITKKELKALFDKAKDGDVIAKYILNGETVNVVKYHSTVSIDFDEKYLRVLLKDGITPDRTKNLIKASEQIRETWMKNPSLIPDDIHESLLKKFPNQSIDDVLEYLDGKDLYGVIQKSAWVLHESIDLQSVSLVPRPLHDKVGGYHGISHFGGVGLAKYIKSHMGSIYFDRFVSAAASAAIIGGK